MSWQDWGDVRKERGDSKGDLFSKKNRNTRWTDGEAAALDKKQAEKAFRKNQAAIAEQKKKAEEKQRRADLQRKLKAEEKARKKAEKAARRAAQ